MGAYLTWQPGARTTDADRNCISNIRPEGIGYVEAACKLAQMLRAMRARRLSATDGIECQLSAFQVSTESCAQMLL